MILASILPFIYGALIATARTLPTIPQLFWLDQTSISMAGSTEKVPGHNNATFCSVPRGKQLFEVDFLEIAPDPVPVNQIFFVYLRGSILAEVASAEALANARLRITGEAALDPGGRREPQSFEIPLKTTTYGEDGHLSIRNGTGAYNERLSPGRNDVLGDVWIPGLFVQTGLWTFQVEGILDDGRHLFCFRLRQWLEHKIL